jgi:hypothetical protein
MSLPDNVKRILKSDLQAAAVNDAAKMKIATYTACMVRNPVSRLISAWKSKLACGRPGGHSNAARAVELYGTDVSDTHWLIPPLLKGALKAEAGLVKQLRGKKCIAFEDMLRLLEAYRGPSENRPTAKATGFGNEHLALQTNICNIRPEGGYYRDVIPMEHLGGGEPAALLPLANHLGIDLKAFPYPHLHASSSQGAAPVSAEDRFGGDFLNVKPEIVKILKRMERIAREDVNSLSFLVDAHYPHGGMKEAAAVEKILEFDRHPVTPE